jgi:hypothetical protein
MPARREYTPEELRARLEREREQTRLRVARWRARHHVTATQNGNAHAVTVTASPRNGTVTGTPPHPPSPPLSLEREIRAALEPLTRRGYVHDPRFWVLASEQYPLLCLELEALKLADWLQEPRNQKRRCSKAFLDNWLKKAEADRLARAAAPSGPNPLGAAARMDPPIAFQHNRQPDAPRHLNGDLLPIDKDDFQRTLAAARGVPLEQKLARLKALKGGKG